MRRIKTHPGEILTEVLPAAGLDAKSAAKILGVSETYMQSVLDSQAPLTKPMTEKLGEYFKNSPQFWENLQNGYDESVRAANNAKNRSDLFKKPRGPK